MLTPLTYLSCLPVIYLFYTWTCPKPTPLSQSNIHAGLCPVYWELSCDTCRWKKGDKLLHTNSTTTHSNSTDTCSKPTFKRAHRVNLIGHFELTPAQTKLLKCSLFCSNLECGKQMQLLSNPYLAVSQTTKTESTFWPICTPRQKMFLTKVTLGT